MKATKTFLSIAFTILATIPGALAATSVVTPPVGFVTGTCRANSDTIVSVPLMHAPDYMGTISGAPTLNGTAATITAAGTTAPGWTANQFAALYAATPSFPTYYIKFTSGTLSGKFFTITANSAGSITFDTGGDAITGAATGDQFSVIKYWTLGELFPPATQTTFVPSASTKSKDRMSLLGIPYLSGTGYNIAPRDWYLIYGTGGTGVWCDMDYNEMTNQVLYPNTYFIVRHTPGKVTSDTTWVATGSVDLDKSVVPLSTAAPNEYQDNYASFQRPVGVKLSESGLSAGFAISSSSKSKDRKDMLLVYDNTAPGINNSAEKIFILQPGGIWTDLDDVNQNSYQIQPGLGFIVRKRTAGTGGQTVFWTNEPNYSN